MTFTNLPLDPAELPQAATLELQPPDAAYRLVLQLQWRLTALLLFITAAALFYFIPDWRDRTAMFTTGILLAGVLALWYAGIALGWPWRGWALRTHDIVYRSGWIFRNIKICPFNRVQNCSLNRGPLDRRYGVATLVLYTAGSDGADLKLHGLPLHHAENIREFLLNRIHGTETN